MMKHTRGITCPRPAMATDTSGFQINVLVFLQFVVNVLTAVDSLFTRKNTPTT